MYIGKVRKMFSKEWLTAQGFPNAVKGGYPDMGNGRYAAKLSDDDWLKFNNYQRAHYNVCLPTTNKSLCQSTLLIL
jgi:hypothetical protein